MTTLHWCPGIGDASFVGWVITLGYFISAALCLKAGTVSEQQGGEKSRSSAGRLWFLLGGALTCLGTNKQLDLQTLLTEVGRGLARRQGWYPVHRTVQVVLVLCVALAGLVSILLFVLLARGRRPGHGLAVGGVVLLASFVVIRAASFHHVDQWLGWRLGAWKLHWIIELGGILCVAAGAIIEATRSNPQGVRPSG